MTACRFLRLYLVAAGGIEAERLPSPAARRGSPMQRSPALTQRASPGWLICCSMRLIKPKDIDPNWPVATRASRAPSRLLSPWHRPHSLDRRSTGSGGACR